MKLLFKQCFFSWFDSYDIYNEAGNIVFTVEGKMAWGHKLQISDSMGNSVGTVEEKIFSFLPKFYLYIGENCIGTISKKFTFFRPEYRLDFNGWQISGNFMEWDYRITDSSGKTAAVISKEILNWTDTYTIETADDRNALCALMVTLAIDAEKCSRN